MLHQAAGMGVPATPGTAVLLRRWRSECVRLLAFALIPCLLCCASAGRADDSVEVGADPGNPEGSGPVVEITQSESVPTEDQIVLLAAADTGESSAEADAAAAAITPLDSGSDYSAPQWDPDAYQMPTDHAELIRYILEGYSNPELSLSLDGAICMALEHNHSLNSQRLRAAAATKQREIVWADLKPQLGLSSKLSQGWAFDTKSVSVGGVSTSREGAGDLTWNVALSLTQRIYDWGLNSHQVDQAEAQHAIQYYTTNAAEQELVYDVISAYYNFNLALGQLRVRRDELTLSQQFLRIAQIQYEVGVVPRLDVIRAEARVQQSENSLIQAQSTLGNAAALFFSLLGVEDNRYVPEVVTAGLVDMGPEPVELQSAIDTAIELRPEVELQYQTLFAGEVARELARNRPLLNAYADGLFQTPNSAQVGHHNYELGLQLVWNVSTGGKDRRQREQAEINLRSIEESIHDLEAQIELDATTAWNSNIAARGSAEAARKNLELSAEALRAATVGYRAGVTKYIEFQSALDENIAAAIGYLNALVNVKLAEANLARAQGFPELQLDGSADGSVDQADMQADGLPDTTELRERLDGEKAAPAGGSGSGAAPEAGGDGSSWSAS